MMGWDLQVAYPIEDVEDMKEGDEKITKILGKNISYSGFGASWAGGKSVLCSPMRDLGFSYETFSDVRKAHETVKNSGIQGIRVRVRDT